jgi:hypothetical protein
VSKFSVRKKTKGKSKCKRKNRKSSQYYREEKRRQEKLKNKVDGEFLAYETVKIVKHHFPAFYESLENIEDPRIQAHYGIDEIVFGAVSMFLFKTGSRNNYNNFRKTGRFAKNYKKAFGLRLPGMDAVADVIKEMQETELEKLKTEMIRALIEKKVFHKMRFQGKFLVAIDGTGIATYKKRHCEDCLYTQSKKTGVKTYYHKVLEAKIVTSNNFSISICTVWIDNEDTNNGKYDKQGCETKAFKKLSEKLKKAFPRLPICLCADGLYPKEPFFQTCKDNNWDYIVTLKDGNLKRLWEKIRLENRQYRKHDFTEGSDSYRQDIQWLNNKEHNGFTHNWIQCRETKTEIGGEIKKARFVHLTSFEINNENSVKISASGRLRWKIEKQGFDQQKNHGYNIEHKYCRTSYPGLKNFYQCCQIAHIINQLVELSKNFKAVCTAKMSIKFMWEMMRGFMIFSYLKASDILRINEHKYQIQYPE